MNNFSENVTFFIKNFQFANCKFFVFKGDFYLDVYFIIFEKIFEYSAGKLC